MSEGEDEEATEDRQMGWCTAARSKLTGEVKAGDNDLPPVKLPVRKGPPGPSEGVSGRN